MSRQIKDIRTYCEAKIVHKLRKLLEAPCYCTYDMAFSFMQQYSRYQKF